MRPGLPLTVNVYTGLVAVAGAVWLAFLITQESWGSAVIGDSCFFIVLIVVTGSFPLPVARRATADLSTAVLFGLALVLEPGIAVATAVAGKFITYLVINELGDRLKLPSYKYPYYKVPFNLGETAITTAVASVLFHSAGTSGDYLTPFIIPAAAAMYLTNTTLITTVISLESKTNPLQFWWTGTKENGLAELSLLAFGFLGAVVYDQTPWAAAALIIPVAILYLAFSRLAATNARLETALDRVETLHGRILSTAKLASVGAISLDLAHQIKNPLAIVLGRLEGLVPAPQIAAPVFQRGLPDTSFVITIILRK